MGICWYCYWGWSKCVADIYDKALAALDGYEDPLISGPAHVVWADDNFHSAEWCLEHFNDNKYGYSEEELAIVKQSLEKLVKIPLKDRCVEPDKYEGEYPELFPPSAGIEMRKR